MNDQTAQTLKKISYTVLLFFTIFLVLAGVQYLTEPMAEAGIKRSAETLLLQWNNSAPKIGEKIVVNNLGWSFTHVYHIKNSPQDMVFVVRITGNSGPYTGVFYYTPKNGTVFCGLAGLSRFDTSAEKYGITDRIITNWSRKINILALQIGALQ